MLNDLRACEPYPRPTICVDDARHDGAAVDAFDELELVLARRAGLFVGGWHRHVAGRKVGGQPGIGDPYVVDA